MTDRDMWDHTPEREEVGGPLPEPHSADPEHVAEVLESARALLRKTEGPARLKRGRRG